MMFAAAAASSIKLNDFPWDLTAFSVTLLCKAWLVLELRTEMRAELSILLSRIQILCFLLALKGITSGMIWDAATSAKGQMSIGREDLVLPRQQAGQGSRRRSFFSPARAGAAKC